MGAGISWLTRRRALVLGALAVALIGVVALPRGGEPESVGEGQERDAADEPGEGSARDATDSASEADGRGDDPPSEVSPPGGSAEGDDPPSEASPPGGSAAGDDVAEADWDPGSLAPVPVDPVVVNDPIDLDDTGDFGTGLTMEVLLIEPVDGEATGRFEVAGPALQIHLQAINDTDDLIPLARTQVDVSYGEDRTPGLALSGPDVIPFPTTLAAGERARATVVFRVPVDQRDQVQILVNHGTDAPTIVFEGAAT